MKKAARVLFGISFLVLLGSFATCHFGVNYAIKQERLAGYEGDTDWIGFEWLERGGLIFLVAIILVITATALLVLDRRRKINQH